MNCTSTGATPSPKEERSEADRAEIECKPSKV